MANYDLGQVLDFILPLVQDGRQGDAQAMITEAVQPQAFMPQAPVPQQPQTGGGLMDVLGVVGGLLGGQSAPPQQTQAQQGGIDLGALVKLAPVLIGLIRPEHIERVMEFIGDLLTGKAKPAPRKKAASTTRKKASTTTAKKKTSTATTAKKTTAAKKKTTATPTVSKAAAAKKSTAAAPKKASTAAAKKASTAAKKKTAAVPSVSKATAAKAVKKK